jgi:hypothetical protein
MATAPPALWSSAAVPFLISPSFALLAVACTSPHHVPLRSCVPNSRLGIFLGYFRSLSVLYYYDVESSIVKTATHARFDEGMNDLATVPPNVQALRHLSPDGCRPRS